MNTIDEFTGMDFALKAEMQAACDRLAKGLPFSREEKERAAAEIDRMREENERRLGLQNVAVDAVRQFRDSR